ncbi:MAG: flagellar biosynthesis protein FliQ [bacterium]
MSEAIVIDIGRQALLMILTLIAPVLGLGLLAGLIVAIFQATTSIQEQTLAFIPKIVTVLVAIGFFGPWMLTIFLDFVITLFENIPQYIG